MVFEDDIKKANGLGALRALRTALKADMRSFFDLSDEKRLEEIELWSDYAESAFQYLRHDLFNNNREWVIERLRMFRGLCLRIHEIEKAAVAANCAIA